MNNTAQNVLFIKAKGDNEYLDLTGRGYAVFDPYHGHSIFFRILREISFRLNLPFREIWYKALPDMTKYHAVIIFDVLITAHYLKWLQSRTDSQTKMVFYYGNLVGHARHIKPDVIPERYEVFSYDENDAKNYHIKLNNHVAVSPAACHLPRENKNIDVLFIGIDKGRGCQLKEIEDNLNKNGLTTFFYIVPNRKHPLQNPKGNKPLKYKDYLNYVSRSKCVLNYVYEGQTGISLRDIEALTNRIKLMTNNRSIIDRFFYDPEDVFVLGIDNEDKLKSFVDTPFKDLVPAFHTYYSFESWLSAFID